jgi:hypothetical protein
VFSLIVFFRTVFLLLFITFWRLARLGNKDARFFG